MAKVLISGGAGFIGSHLCDHFVTRGFEVVCVDNLISGTRENLRHLLPSPLFTFLPMGAEDVRSESLPKPKGRIDYVLHFGCPASPEYYQQFPLETLSAGAEATRAMLEVARKHNSVFLLASTSEVYGDPLEHPQREGYWGNVNSIGPRSMYDESKRFAEALTMAYRRRHQVDTRIVRIFNTYGPRMQAGDGRVIPNFITQAVAGRPITVYGDGSQTRSFCFYTDLVRGLIALLEKGDDMPVNLGNPHEYTMIELAEHVIELTRSKSAISHQPLPQDDPKRRKPDIARARTLLGWEPQVSLEDGLAATIEWFNGPGSETARCEPTVPGLGVVSSSKT